MTDTPPDRGKSKKKKRGKGETAHVRSFPFLVQRVLGQINHRGRERKKKREKRQRRGNKGTSVLLYSARAREPPADHLPVPERGEKGRRRRKKKEGERTIKEANLPR